MSTDSEVTSLEIEPKSKKTCEESNATNNTVAISDQVVRSCSYWNPLSWVKSNDDKIEAIETRIFKSLNIPLNRFFVNIRNESLRIWTISANTESKNIPIVLVHGYCGAVGLWVHNIEPLAADRPFYAFDLLGFGRSSRPPFSSDPIVSEMQFVESIECWRKEMGLKEFILLGHSFGGFISSAYSLKYPDYVKGLVLADPWGFSEMETGPKEDTPIPMWISVLTTVSQYVSPMTVFRTSGQLGIQLFKYLRPDFKKKYITILDEPELVYNYLYHANNYHPSGEEGFRAVSQYHGYAKNPMIKRIEKVKSHIPIWFVYGSRSWIDCTAGYSAIVLRQNVSQDAHISVDVLSGAGHHVYADKPKDFNEHIQNILLNYFKPEECDNSTV